MSNFLPLFRVVFADFVYSKDNVIVVRRADDRRYINSPSTRNNEKLLHSSLDNATLIIQHIITVSRIYRYPISVLSTSATNRGKRSIYHVSK